ncbi:hypothetical protein ACU8LZ_06740 [Rhizobium leguminosarum]|nr:hypothetical protein [Rhizobium leguminosarum]MBP2486870.1 hypothetical protein [Rhizobium leguminosarum]
MKSGAAAEVVAIVLLKLAVAVGDIGKCQQARNGARYVAHLMEFPNAKIE